MSRRTAEELRVRRLTQAGFGNSQRSKYGGTYQDLAMIYENEHAATCFYLPDRFEVHGFYSPWLQTFGFDSSMYCSYLRTRQILQNFYVNFVYKIACYKRKC